MVLKHFLCGVQKKVGDHININGVDYSVNRCQKIELIYHGRTCVLTITIGNTTNLQSKNKTAFYNLFGCANEREFLSIYGRNPRYIETTAKWEYYFLDLSSDFYIFNPL